MKQKYSIAKRWVSSQKLEKQMPTSMLNNHSHHHDQRWHIKKQLLPEEAKKQAC